MALHLVLSTRYCCHTLVESLLSSAYSLRSQALSMAASLFGTIIAVCCLDSGYQWNWYGLYKPFDDNQSRFHSSCCRRCLLYTKCPDLCPSTGLSALSLLALRLVGYLQTIAAQRFWLLFLIGTHHAGITIFYPSIEGLSQEAVDSIVLCSCLMTALCLHSVPLVSSQNGIFRPTSVCLTLPHLGRYSVYQVRGVATPLTK